MIDCHIHISLDGIDFQKSREIGKKKESFHNIKEVLKKYKSLGIYVLRDGGDDLEISSIGRDMAKEEGMVLKSPVYAVYKKGQYGSFLGKEIQDIKDFKEIFIDLKNKQLDHLKIILSGLVSFKKYKSAGEIQFTEKELKYMVNLAKNHNIPTMAHVNTSKGIRIAINSGVNTIEHGYFLGERELYEMGERNVIWVPTLAPLGNLVVNKDKRFERNIPIIKKVYEEHLKMVNKGYEMGIKMALGSDSGSYGVLHGQGTLDEMNHFIKAGIKKEEVIKMSIENGIKACNLKEEEIKCFKNSLNNS